MTANNSYNTAGHEPVLVDPILEQLNAQPGEVYLDCTLGRAGHALLIAQKLGPTGRLIGLDVDEENLAYAREQLADVPCQVDLIHRNFAAASAVLAELGIEGVDVLLADLGFSSNQTDNPERGFSFRQDGPLDMRLNQSLKTTAADMVNNLSERELGNVIFQFGEERLSRRIARKIVEMRAKSPIQRTSDLANIVRGCYPAKSRAASKIDPATRTFMALRIAVNEELAALDRLLEDLPKMLKTGARAGIISFHSLEDRRVKKAFVQMGHRDQVTRLTRKPIIADVFETERNPRSRSAKLRVIRRCPTEDNLE